MVVLLHVIIALSSIALSSYLYFKPIKKVMKASYGLIAGTVLSGSYLIITRPTHMLETCTVGLVYLAIVVAATLATQAKLRHADQL
jgi:hypothetical protein